MAKNTGNGYRRGAVDKRSQTYNPVTEQWVKRNAENGQFMDVKRLCRKNGKEGKLNFL